MKTLLNSSDLDELRLRLSRVGIDSPRQWGTMSAAQMVCHLSDAFLVAIGERPATGKSSLVGRVVVKRAALWIPRQWPHGVPTVPECDVTRQGTPPVEFERDRAQAMALLNRFGSRPRDFSLQEHAIFGWMTEKEWMRWGYLHTDHHLRQFGA